MRQMPGWPPLFAEKKAISSPFGDQIGQSFANSSRVLWWSSPETVFLTQMFRLPLLFDVNATQSPLGEKAPMLFTSPGTLAHLTTSLFANVAGGGARTVPGRRATTHQTTATADNATTRPSSNC